VVVTVGGGSNIDATKAAVAYLALGAQQPNLDAYFGVANVTAMLRETATTMLPIVAVQLAASSGAHLTKYANITDLATAQKLLIVDEAVVPSKALFDYALTTSMPRALTSDGALDGVSQWNAPCNNGSTTGRGAACAWRCRKPSALWHKMSARLFSIFLCLHFRI
jgi:alcohol dehydrogenase class IV